MLTIQQAKADENIPATPDDNTSESDFGSEDIVVTRPADLRDPEADAEFDRELAKLMSESIETRKTERRPMFDVALPMRKAQRDSSLADSEDGQATPPNTIKFALLSKKGNRPQVC